MTLITLKEVLKRIDPRLYIRDKDRKVSYSHDSEVVYVGGIYLKETGGRGTRLTGSDWNAASISAAQRRYREDLVSGNLDKFICGVSFNGVPEYDIYNLDTSDLVMPGWRSIAKVLALKKVASWDQIKRAFRCNSLGENDYDKLNFYGKLAMMRKRKDGLY